MIINSKFIFTVINKSKSSKAKIVKNKENIIICNKKSNIIKMDFICIYVCNCNAIVRKNAFINCFLNIFLKFIITNFTTLHISV
jgi:hypothetical protein